MMPAVSINSDAIFLRKEMASKLNRLLFGLPMLPFRKIRCTTVGYTMFLVHLLHASKR